jgi:hypothetical protein
MWHSHHDSRVINAGFVEPFVRLRVTHWVFPVALCVRNRVRPCSSPFCLPELVENELRIAVPVDH